MYGDVSSCGLQNFLKDMCKMKMLLLPSLLLIVVQLILDELFPTVVVLFFILPLGNITTKVVPVLVTMDNVMRLQDWYLLSFVRVRREM